MGVGVLPPGFRSLSSRARFFTPVASRPEELGPARRHDNNYQMIARLSAGASVTDAQSEIDAFNILQAAGDPNL